MVTRELLNDILRQLLDPEQLQDYAPNGLQVEGRAEIRKLVTGVTASQALLDAAVAAGADAILVHHGYFWKGESAAVVGMKQRRLKTLLTHDLNLFAYHLPIDVHPSLGNNVQLGQRLGLAALTPVPSCQPHGVVYRGNFATPQPLATMIGSLESILGRRLVCVEDTGRPIQQVAWCTGGGQGFIDNAAAANMDLFITGEVSEQTIHSAREQKISFIAAGHHATERFGVSAVGEYLQTHHGITHEFIDIDNPA